MSRHFFTGQVLLGTLFHLHHDPLHEFLDLAFKDLCRLSFRQGKKVRLFPDLPVLLIHNEVVKNLKFFFSAPFDDELIALFAILQVSHDAVQLTEKSFCSFNVILHPEKHFLTETLLTARLCKAEILLMLFNLDPNQ